MRQCDLFPYGQKWYTWKLLESSNCKLQLCYFTQPDNNYLRLHLSTDKSDNCNSILWFYLIWYTLKQFEISEVLHCISAHKIVNDNGHKLTMVLFLQSTLKYSIIWNNSAMWDIYFVCISVSEVCGNVYGSLYGHVESSFQSLCTTVAKREKSDRIDFENHSVLCCFKYFLMS